MASKQASTRMFAATAVVAMAAVIVVIAAATATAVSAVSDGSGPRSYLTSWAGPGCTTGEKKGHIASSGSCGCNHIRFHGGHEFNFRGETATLYTEAGCTGTPYQVFEDTRACGASVGTVSTSTADHEPDHPNLSVLLRPTGR